MTVKLVLNRFPFLDKTLYGQPKHQGVKCIGLVIPFQQIILFYQGNFWFVLLMFYSWAFCISFCITLRKLAGTNHSSMAVWRGFCISTLKLNYFQNYPQSQYRQNVTVQLLELINPCGSFRLLEAAWLNLLSFLHAENTHFRSMTLCFRAVNVALYVCQRRR